MRRLTHPEPTAPDTLWSHHQTDPGTVKRGRPSTSWPLGYPRSRRPSNQQSSIPSISPRRIAMNVDVSANQKAATAVPTEPSRPRVPARHAGSGRGHGRYAGSTGAASTAAPMRENRDPGSDDHVADIALTDAVGVALPWVRAPRPSSASRRMGATAPGMAAGLPRRPLRSRGGVATGGRR